MFSDLSKRLTASHDLMTNNGRDLAAMNQLPMSIDPVINNNNNTNKFEKRIDIKFIFNCHKK